MVRTVTPELLDSLAPDSPEARHSRRDLVWFNRLLGANRWWGQTLPRLQSNPSALPGLEIGAGDGRLASQYHLAALDRCAPPTGWPDSASWHQHDVMTFNRWDLYPLIVANLFLHHLEADQLSQLGQVWNRTAKVIVACEPWRAHGFQSGFALLCTLIQAHPVSRHDGRVSIAAGFRQNELPHLLGLDPARWSWQITPHLLGTYRFIAQRRDVT